MRPWIADFVVFSRKLSGVIVKSASLVLFLSLFMPAANGCNRDVIYPYELHDPVIYAPYIWGLCIFLIMSLSRIVSIKIFLRLVYFVILLIWYGSLIWTFASSATQQPDRSLILLAIVSGIVTALNFQVYKRWKLYLDKDFFRSIWTHGLLAGFFFLIFLFEPHLYGVNVSFGCAILIFMGGLFNEYSEYEKKE